jgi:hypothetical protein
MRRYILVACLIAMCVHITPLYGEIEVKHDRFTKGVTVQTKPHGSSSRPSLFLFAVLGGIPQVSIVEGRMIFKMTPSVTIQLWSMSHTGWQYLSCHSLYWLVDGKSFPLPQPRHEGDAESGYVLEFLEIKDVEVSQIETLAKAKRVEYKVCSDEFVVSPAEMNDLRTFHKKITDPKTWE